MAMSGNRWGAKRALIIIPRVDGMGTNDIRNTAFT